MLDNRRNILVKIREEGDHLISLQTYDRANGKSMLDAGRQFGDLEFH